MNLSTRPTHRAVLAILALSLSTACSGGGTTLTAHVTPTPGATSTASATPSPAPTEGALGAATGSVCFTPGTAAQTVAIPSTAGVTGSLTIAAFADAAASCDVTVTFDTGADADLDGTAPVGNARRRDTNANGSKPIFEIDLSDAFKDNVEMTGAALMTPATLNIPDGTYNAVVVDSNGVETGLVFMASGGVLTLQSSGQPIVVMSGSLSKLYVYNRGVVPGLIQPSASPTPMPSGMPTASPTASPTATATPTAVPTVSPSPTPAPDITGNVTISPSGCVQFGGNGGTQVFSATVVSNAPKGTTFVYGWFPPKDQMMSNSVPGQSFGLYYAAAGLEFIAGYQNTSTLTVYSDSSQAGGPAGGGQQELVALWMQVGTGQNATQVPVMQANGSQAIAAVNIDEGLITCN